MEWADELPGTWEARRLKEVASTRNSNVDKKSYDDGVPVRLCNYTDVYYNEYITPDLELMEATATHKEIEKFSLAPGDVIITKDSETWDDIGVPACVRTAMPGVVCGYHLTLIRPHPDRMEGRFLLRTLQATGVRDQLWVSANGVTRFGLTQEGIRTAVVPVPPFETQRAIADFLDRKTAAIDALIEKKERLIALLQEKRQALITQAVTKGLDPSVPMKDSGIEWLGEVPAHWEVERGRFLFRQVQLPPREGDGVVTAFRDGQVTLRELRRSDGFMIAEKEIGYQHVREGDLVLHSMDAFAGAIGVAEASGKCTPEYVVLEPRRAGRAVNGYYASLLRLMALRGYVFVICPSVRERAPRFRYATFKDVLLPVPPQREQEAIQQYVSSAGRDLIALAKKLEEQVVRLREYRQALITAAVTGQIDVTKEAA